MNSNKILVAESGFQQKLLKEISKVKDYSKVPETLYYEAVSTKKYLEQMGIEDDIQAILDLFINTTDVSNLSKAKLKTLTKEKKRPKSATRKILLQGNILQYLYNSRVSILFLLTFFIFLFQPFWTLPVIVLAPCLILFIF